MRAVISAIGACGILMFGGAFAADLDVEGMWYTPDRNAIVEIADCGDGTPCGVVRWVGGRDGETVCDENNRDPSLRERPMVGITLLEGFVPGEDRWRSGAIYNPEDGRTYRARLELVSETTLAVSGCLGPICKKLLWERAEGKVVSSLAEESDGSEDVASL